VGKVFEEVEMLTNMKKSDQRHEMRRIHHNDMLSDRLRTCTNSSKCLLQEVLHVLNPLVDIEFEMGDL
jgi:ribosomal protein L32